jgi:hypothetical protein
MGRMNFKGVENKPQAITRKCPLDVQCVAISTHLKCMGRSLKRDRGFIH